MSHLNIILISIGLAMDAFSVSVSNGIIIEKIKVHNALRIALFFGVFQSLMPLIGWWGGTKLKWIIGPYGPWAAFIILLYIGIKMIIESLKEDVDNEKICKEKSCLNINVLLVMSVITSIDAFAVGISFAVLKVKILEPVIFIGVITFILSFAGVYIGRVIGHFSEKRIEIIGGIMLILIGFKILIEHYI